MGFLADRDFLSTLFQRQDGEEELDDTGRSNKARIKNSKLYVKMQLITLSSMYC